MTCLAPATLQALADDELDPISRAAAERHLGACADCRAALARCRECAGRIAACFAGLGEAPPVSVRERYPIFGRLQAAGMAAVLLLGIAVLRHQPSVRLTTPAQPAATQVFTPIPGAAPFQMAAVERVTLPLQVIDPDPSVPPNVFVQADIVVGEDGAPRAWRLVTNSQAGAHSILEVNR